MLQKQIADVTNYIALFYRSFDVSIIFFSLLWGFFYQNTRGYILSILVALSILVSGFLKIVVELLFGDAGRRPVGAKGCGYMGDGGFAKSYGMPSGHAQTFTFVATLLALSLWKRDKKDIRIGVLLILVLGAMWARVVWQKCHTFWQVVVGAIIGVILAFTANYYVKNPFE